jgi:alpha-acetolactate decarboxylase
LDGQILELDQGTKARNRAFQERLDEVWRSTAGFEAKLRTEAKEAVETILNMKENYQNHIDKWNLALQSEINGIFDKLDNELLPEQSARVDAIDSNLDVFVKDTVPAAIERQSGEVSRQLRRAYETFEIEKKKERKR